MSPSTSEAIAGTTSNDTTASARGSPSPAIATIIPPATRLASPWPLAYCFLLLSIPLVQLFSHHSNNLASDNNRGVAYPLAGAGLWGV